MKINTYLLVVLLLLSGGITAYPQSLETLMPYEIADAYRSGTRSFDGKPGTAYWQNTADYQIGITLDTERKLLEGEEQVIYHNNSPDELKNLVLNIFHDAFRKGNARHEAIKPSDTERPLEIKSILIDSRPYDISDNKQVIRSGTRLDIQLDSPLPAGDSLILKIGWTQPIPVSNGRTRVYEASNYMIAYFYPQIAVYDDLFGWDMMDYNLETEFYHSLANYDVRIEAPKDYYVLATGQLINAEAVLPAAVAERYQQAMTSGEPVAIIDKDILAKGFRASSRTWHYRAEQVPDFAITATDNYLWDALSVDVGERKVLVHNLYPQEESQYYQSIIQDAKSAVEKLSGHFPAVAYPYPTLINFKGAFWMEYPMISNSAWASGYETLHEAIHMYFPFFVRTNERRWAWMDEGWAEYLSSYLQFIDVGEKPFDEIFIPFKGKAQMYVGGAIDMPLMVPSISQTAESYTLLSYGVAATALGVLHHQLGEEVFLKCTQAFIDRWKYKSPTPFDFFYTYEDVSGQDLEWLLKPWFFEFGSPDVAIKSLDGNVLTVENKGNRPVPLFVDLVYKSGDTHSQEHQADIWAQGDRQVEITLPPAEDIEKIYVNRRLIDRKEDDNYYPSLSQRYDNGEVNAVDAIVGYYQSKEIPQRLKVWEEDDVYYLKVRDQDKPIALYPVEAGAFATLDDFITLRFYEEGDPANLQLKIRFLTDEYHFSKVQ